MTNMWSLCFYECFVLPSQRPLVAKYHFLKEIKFEMTKNLIYLVKKNKKVFYFPTEPSLRDIKSIMGILICFNAPSI